MSNQVQEIETAAAADAGKASATPEELAEAMDTRGPARLGLWVLGIGLGGFLAWAALAPLDAGVPTVGMVSIDTKRKEVQHLTGGVVSEVMVKEGQFVEAGQSLIVIDDSNQKADYTTSRLRYLSMRAAEGRLLAEQNNLKSIQWHSSLENVKDDSVVKQLLDNQLSLFRSRRQAYESEQQVIRENIQAQEASIAGFEGLLKSRKAQLDYAQEELLGMRDLVKEGYAPRSRQLDLERQVAEFSGGIADLQANILRARSTIAEKRMLASQRTQEYRKDIDTQLADVRRDVDGNADKYSASSVLLDRTVIRAPVGGQVVGLVAQTVGGVIKAGEKLMDIVPQQEVLLLESRVPPHIIDTVEPGQKTDVHFDTFANTPGLVAEGKLDSISTDLVTDPGDHTKYYLARVSLTPDGMKRLGKRQLQAGMPVTVIIKTGERTMLQYLLHPLLKRLAASLKEE